MFKKALSLLLIGLITSMANTGPAFAQSSTQKEAQKIEKTKQDILSLGIGPQARVRVKLRDKKILEGYISQVGADSFTVTAVKTGTPATIGYAQVKRIQGHNYLTGVIIGGGPGTAGKIFLKWIPMAFGLGLAGLLVVDILIPDK